eukprot:TRINITY_DN9677_c0_g1_i1.p1 TRINITY_DN9677_c0_g1~~TRINITY_DN9677_c0_g1_i1.p1  ORF type:complete len:497 (-),score=132.91 TRINITY_DN9677_c0_g1_i1:36-1526(-)
MERLYINGKWTQPLRGSTLEVINPATEEILSVVPSATIEDVDLAVEAARNAFEGEDGWALTTGAERAVYLRKIAEEIKIQTNDLAVIESNDCGKPYREAQWDVEDVASCFEYYAELAEQLDEKQNTPVSVSMPDEFDASLYYSPVGVVGAIIPWNYPMLMAAWKVAPALAAGCTMVLKPSEETPLTAIELAKIIDKVELPDGVFNLVIGTGIGCGDPLVKHCDVDKIAFTGSYPTGSLIMKNCAKDIKNVSLELGGKSPIVVFDDVDIEKAVEWIMFGCFWTNGQICSATSRLLVHENIASKLLAKLKVETEKINIAPPMSNLDPTIGPLVSKGQYERVLYYISEGKAEGATVLTGGGRPDGFDVGFYVKPTIFTNVHPGMKIWREEIFGPVLSVMTFETKEEAMRLANDCDYGLGSAVLSNNQNLIKWFTKRIKAGIVWVNCSQPCFVEMPWGGFKRSGIGRELGSFGLQNYLEVKSVVAYTTANPWGWYNKSKL